MDNTMKLKTITFTGVDEYTDINKLIEIQEKYPYVEFGILLSENWNTNDERCPNPKILENYKDKKLNLSGHLCGKIAREAIRNNFEPAVELCNGYFNIFKRCQLNIATNQKNPKILNIDIPDTLEELIIQQKSSNECDLFLSGLPNNKLTVLLDASGGKGIDTPIEVLNVQSKVGYAGGISIDNVISKIDYLENNNDVHSYWIDMESSVRTKNIFDIEKVIEIINKVEQYFNKK